MRVLTPFVVVVGGELEEALHAGLLAPELLGHPVGVVGGESEEVLDAALRVVGQRIDARDVLLRAHDAHRRAALGERACAAHGGDHEPPVGGHERGREQAVRRQLDLEVDPAIDLDAARARSSSGSRQMSSTVSAPTSASRSAVACSEYRCSASSRSSAAARSSSHGTRSSSSRETAAPAPRPPWVT